VCIVDDHTFKKCEYINRKLLPIFSTSYAEICNEGVKDLLKEDCTDVGLLEYTDPFTAAQNLKKQEAHSPNNVSSVTVEVLHYFLNIFDVVMEM